MLFQTIRVMENTEMLCCYTGLEIHYSFFVCRITHLKLALVTLALLRLALVTLALVRLALVTLALVRLSRQAFT